MEKTNAPLKKRTIPVNSFDTSTDTIEKQQETKEKSSATSNGEDGVLKKNGVEAETPHTHEQTGQLQDIMVEDKEEEEEGEDEEDEAGDMDPQQAKRKRERRLAMNRDSARNRRKRKKVQFEELRQRVLRMEEELDALRQANTDLKGENKMLRSLLGIHQSPSVNSGTMMYSGVSPTILHPPTMVQFAPYPRLHHGLEGGEEVQRSISGLLGHPLLHSQLQPVQMHGSMGDQFSAAVRANLDNNVPGVPGGDLPPPARGSLNSTLVTGVGREQGRRLYTAARDGGVPVFLADAASNPSLQGMVGDLRVAAPRIGFLSDAAESTPVPNGQDSSSQERRRRSLGEKKNHCGQGDS